MQVERIEEMRLTREDEAQIGTLLDRAFATDFGGRSYYQQRHHLRLVIRHGGQIVGHMAISIRAIRMGERLVQVAGLAEVATDTNHRGKGIASILMQAAIEEVVKSTASFFVLFGDEPLYAGSGFLAKANVLRYTSFIAVRSGQIIQGPKDGLMVLPLTDLPWDDGALIDLVGHAF